MRKDENSVQPFRLPLNELAKYLKADGLHVREINKRGKRIIEFGLRQPLSEEEKSLLKREHLLASLKGHLLLTPLALLEQINRQLDKSKDQHIILFWEYRTTEDIIKLVYHWGKIPQWSKEGDDKWTKFIIDTICSWLRKSNNTYLIDLGKALELSEKKEKQRPLSRVQTFPYVLMNRAYSTLMDRYPVRNPSRRQDEILLRVSKLYKLSRNEVKEILFDRAHPMRLKYVSPFDRLTDREAKTMEWDIWESFLDKRAGTRTDKEAHELVKKEKNISLETVRKACGEVKAIFGIQRKIRGIKSDAELNEIIKQYLSKPGPLIKS